MPQRWTDYRVFWRQFRDAYKSTGAVLPSGRALSFALARFVREGDARVVESGAAGAVLAEFATAESAVFATANLRSEKLPYVRRRILEVGPGTGAVTEQIIRGMRADDQLVLVERNEQFVTHLRERLAANSAARDARERVTLVHASVEELPEDQPFDVIISGLPLNNFSAELVAEILSKLRRLSAPGGVLSFFEYVAIRRAKAIISSAAERRRLRDIERVFDEALHGKEIRRDLVMANVPPAWVHHVQFTAGSLERGAGSKTPGFPLAAARSPLS